MKMLTLNFLTCPRKACKSSPASFPLHPAYAVLLPSSPTCSYNISKETIFGLYEKLLSVARRLKDLASHPPHLVYMDALPAVIGS